MNTKANSLPPSLPPSLPLSRHATLRYITPLPSQACVTADVIFWWARGISKSTGLRHFLTGLVYSSFSIFPASGLHCLRPSISGPPGRGTGPQISPLPIQMRTVQSPLKMAMKPRRKTPKKIVEKISLVTNPTARTLKFRVLLSILQCRTGTWVARLVQSGKR